eukprot:6316461-Pyramimonas_sp.AAC.1
MQMGGRGERMMEDGSFQFTLTCPGALQVTSLTMKTRARSARTRARPRASRQLRPRHMLQKGV